jgi:hypothetical protein
VFLCGLVWVGLGGGVELGFDGEGEGEGVGMGSLRG